MAAPFLALHAPSMPIASCFAALLAVVQLPRPALLWCQACSWLPALINARVLSRADPASAQVQ